jgi:hypothetical protein
MDLAEKMERNAHYFRMRADNPEVPAKDLFAYVNSDASEPLDQFLCRHEWKYTGTAYGGEDESYGGEGRCYCVYCGADGDA